MKRLVYLITRHDRCPDWLAKRVAMSTHFGDELDQSRLLIIECLARAMVHLWRREDIEAAITVGGCVTLFDDAAEIARRGLN